MYTQCPECETTFRLGAEDLRRAKGKVRCGDCNTVFNALEYLEEDVTETATEASADLRNDGWTSSTANPSGDIEPDLDSYEATAYTDEIDTDIDLDGDDEDDDGAILYIDKGDDDIEQSEKTPACENETHAFDSDDQPHKADNEPDNEPEDELDNDLGEELSDEVEDELDSEFDDEIWDNIPGVGDNPDESVPQEPERKELDEAADSGDIHDQNEAGSEDETEDSGTDEPDLANLEFNVPEDKWTNFFGPLPKGQVAAIWKPPALTDAEDANKHEGVADSDSWEDADYAQSAGTNEQENAAERTEDNSADVDEGFTPQWKDSQPSRGPGWLIPLGAVLLAVVLVTQLIHYNRDSLAAHPAYGAQLRGLYSTLNSELYPLWDINGYEIRGSEAIAGETGVDVLDIRAQIANIGEQATGLPRLRVVLRDRWSNPVAAQDFSAEEYTVDQLPTDSLLQPGAVIGAHVSIQDPGSGAQGFELELCLPRRDTGLECTGQPFK